MPITHSFFAFLLAILALADRHIPIYHHRCLSHLLELSGKKIDSFLCWEVVGVVSVLFAIHQSGSFITFMCWEMADSETPSFLERDRTHCFLSKTAWNIFSRIGSPKAFNIQPNSIQAPPFYFSVRLIIAKNIFSSSSPQNRYKMGPVDEYSPVKNPKSAFHHLLPNHLLALQ